MSRIRSGAAALAVALAAAGAAAGAAQASTVVVDGDTLTFRALAGESNTVSIGNVRGSDELRIRDGGVARLADRGVVGCRPSTTANELLCTRRGLRFIRVELGDRNDSFKSEIPVETAVDAGPGDDLLTAFGVVVDPVENLTPTPARLDLTGGTGSDYLRFVVVDSHMSPSTDPGVRVTKDGIANDGRPIDQVNVRPDIEALEGTARNDTLAGGPGADVFVSTRGEDALIGGGGDDRFEMGAIKDGRTRASGGGGRDTVTYAKRTAKVFGSLDLPALTDGEAGEGDQIDGVEVLEGGSGPDAIITSVLTSAGYRLIGGPGDDELRSGDGRDRLIGGPGQDMLIANGGADVVEARDGGRDAIDCGTNGDDTAYVDHRETATRRCETVFRPSLLPFGG